MRLKIVVWLGLLTIAAPGIASAALDPTCTGSLTSVHGNVRSLGLAQPLQGIRIDIFAAISGGANKPVGSNQVISATTDAGGNYRLCLAGINNGLSYEVQASDPLGRYDAKAEPFDVYTNLISAQSIDFSLPLRLFLTISPSAFQDPTSMIVTIKSAATAPDTTMHANFEGLPVVGDQVVPFVGVDPFPGSPYSIWRKTVPLPPTLGDTLPGSPYYVSARGVQGSNVVTTMDRQPWVVDRQAPGIGGNGCGSSGVFRVAGSANATKTTNPQAAFYIGVCDTISGVDITSIKLKVDGTDRVLQITGTPGFFNVLFTPVTPLALGDHTFVYTIADQAGNTQESAPLKITIVDFGGSPPFIAHPTPTPTHPGLGIPGPAFGFGLSNTYPEVTVSLTDGDGQLDLVAGSLSVRMFYGGVERAHYNPNEPLGGDPADPNTGVWFQNTGLFKLNYNFVTNAAPPGIYTVTASISDHGANSTTYTWQFILLFAI